MKMVKNEFDNTARWTVTNINARVAYSLSGTVQDALLVEQCLRHCCPRRASSTVPSAWSVIFV